MSTRWEGPPQNDSYNRDTTWLVYRWIKTCCELLYNYPVLENSSTLMVPQPRNFHDSERVG